MTPKKKALTLAFDAVPLELRERAQWVCWRRELVNGKPTKVPYNARTGRKASTTDARTWSTSATAVRACERGTYAGVGYVFSADDPYTGLDFDHCWDPETGTIAPVVVAEILAFASYAEISPSGTGVHVYLRAQMPDGARHKREGFEAYDRSRFFTVTGQQLPTTPATIAEAQDALDAFCLAHFAPRKTAVTAAPPASRPPCSDSDSELLMRARNDLKSGTRFCTLFDRGDLAAYGGDDSAADLALCNHLAYWCGPGSEQRIDSLFRQSQLMRDKWEQRADYRAWTIDKALDGRTDFAGNGARERGIVNQVCATSPAHEETESETVRALRAELERTRGELERARAEAAALRVANVELNKRLTWHERVAAVPTPVLNASAKATLPVVVRELARVRPEQLSDDGMWTPYLPTLAQKCGVSAGTLGANLQRYEQIGIIRRKEYPRTSELTGKTVSRTAIALGDPDALAAPETWTAPEDKQPHGGARKGAGRPKLCRCGSADLFERTIHETVCRTCGEVAREQIGPNREVNPPDVLEEGEADAGGEVSIVNQVWRPDDATCPPTSVADPEGGKFAERIPPPGSIWLPRYQELRAAGIQEQDALYLAMQESSA